jgi:N-acetyl-anhydromuramyl-L-alanine amidase AmpD
MEPRSISLPGDIPEEWCPPVPDNGWKVIVLHHSASDFGGAKTFDTWHREKNGWDELGYHFVIGNGTDTPDGTVEVGSRWRKQKYGAHAMSEDGFYNHYGIGICVVGNFEHSTPTPEQMESLRRLMVFLMDRYQIGADQVYGHQEVKGNDTLCPGRYFPLDSLRYWLFNACK